MRMEEEDDDDRYVELEDSGTVTTAAGIPNAPPDATAAVHETYWALLFLLSHPDQWETPRTTTTTPQVSTASTLQHWNEEESLYTTNDEMTAPPPSESQLPYAVFCDDAEVVLPQAHTASQLFGLETVTGMELEAAAGIPAISALVLRWLALMPGGDHLNLLGGGGAADGGLPLTVMRIAGGRYRVTAAHKVVWTWMNEFAPLVVVPTTNNSTHSSSGSTSAALDAKHTTSSSGRSSSSAGGLHTLQVGDLVSMTIVDVFESDHSGKLLSYCPTFDNRAVVKLDRTAHALRKQSVHVRSMLAQVQSRATAWTHSAANLAQQVQQRVAEAVQKHAPVLDRPATLDPPHPEMEEEVLPPPSPQRTASAITTHSSMYHGDDDLERHEV